MMRKNNRFSVKKIVSVSASVLLFVAHASFSSVDIDTQQNILTADLNENDVILDNNVNIYFGAEIKQDSNSVEPSVTLFAENNGNKFRCNAKRSLNGDDYLVLESLALHLGKAGHLQVTSAQGNCTNISFTNLSNFVPKSSPSVNRDYGLMFPTVAGSTVYKPCTPRTAVTFGVALSGSLASTDCVYSFLHLNDTFFDKSPRYTDRFSFSAQPGQQIAISVTGNFDTFVTLRDANGGIVDRNDDSNNSTNSRIPAVNGTFLTIPDATLVSGNFVIEVTSYSSNTLGNYTLSLTKQ